MRIKITIKILLTTLVVSSMFLASGCKKLFEHQVTPTFSMYSGVFDIDSNSVDTATGLKLFKLTNPFTLNIDSVLTANKVDIKDINSLVVTSAKAVIIDTDPNPYTSNLFKTFEGSLRNSATSTTGQIMFLADYDISRNNDKEFDINKKDDGYDVKEYINGTNKFLYLNGVLNQTITHKFKLALKITYYLDGKSTKIGI